MSDKGREALGQKRGRWWARGWLRHARAQARSLPTPRAFNRSRHNVNIVANWRGVIVTEEGGRIQATCFPRNIHTLASRGDTRANLSAWSLERTLIVFVRAPRARYVHPLTSYSPLLPPPSFPSSFPLSLCLLTRSVSPLGLFDGAPLN